MNKFFDKNREMIWEKFIEDPENPSLVFSNRNNLLDRWAKKTHETYGDKSHFVTSLYSDFLGGESDMFYCLKPEEQGEPTLIGAVIITQPIYKGNNAVIEYIIVDPRQRNSGYATRMVQSITNNKQFFAGANHKGSFEAVVNENNIPSQMVFIKNNYEAITKSTLVGNSQNLRFFATERSLTKE